MGRKGFWRENMGCGGARLGGTSGWGRCRCPEPSPQGCTSPLGKALPVSLSEVLGIYQRKALGSEKPTKY